VKAVLIAVTLLAAPAAFAQEVVLMNEVWSEVDGGKTPSLWRSPDDCFLLAETTSSETGTVNLNFIRKACKNDQGEMTESPFEGQLSLPVKEIQYSSGSPVNVLPEAATIVLGGD
jgi:hypothetical protein